MKTYTREIIILTLSIIIISLIYVMLEMGIGFTKILDFKTIFLGFATFGGAALGAMLAGRYTLKSVQLQIDIQNKQNEKKQNEILLRAMHEFDSSTNVVNNYFNSNLIDALNLTEEFFSDYNSNTLTSVKNFLSKHLNSLYRYNISEIYYDEYFLFRSTIVTIESMVENLEVMEKSLNNNDYEMYKICLVMLLEDRNELKEDINHYKEEIEKLKNQNSTS